jgi:hypothetical protein
MEVSVGSPEGKAAIQAAEKAQADQFGQSGGSSAARRRAPG